MQTITKPNQIFKQLQPGIAIGIAIALQAIAPERTLVLETTNFTPQQIAQKVIKYIRYR